MILFSLDSWESFLGLDYWINEIKNENNAIYIIVGNKSDLHDTRKVTMEEGINYALSKSCIYMECSAKDYNLAELVFLTAIEADIQAKYKNIC